MSEHNARPAVMSLTGVALFCGLLISSLHYFTKDTIAENQANFAARQLRQVLGNATDDIMPLDQNLYYTSKNGQPSGFIFRQTNTEGYNGNIDSWVAVDNKLTIRGVRVIKHHETPGIGDFIDTNVSNWLESFNGVSLAANNINLLVDGGEIDQVTGATITSRALSHLVQDGLQQASLNQVRWQEMLTAIKGAKEIPASE